jgi:radical SAM superfamily enzyme YgiQ (UPF0313 family)
MRIALIALSGVRVRTAELAALGVTLPGFVRRGKVIASLPSLGLLTVAGLTPEQHEVELFEVDDGPWPAIDPASYDVIGLSSFTARIEDAYALADDLRRRGGTVVIGGLHASLLPGEALEHADAVLVGGAESAWPRLLEDVERGRLERLYVGQRDRVFEPGVYARPRFDLLRGRAYNRVTVQTSRGCPRNCDFCAASLRITRKFQQKPVELVIEEIREARRYVDEPFFEFADDNTFLDRAWSKDLLRAPSPRGDPLFHGDRRVRRRRPRALRSPGALRVPAGPDRIREPVGRRPHRRRPRRTGSGGACRGCSPASTRCSLGASA